MKRRPAATIEGAIRRHFTDVELRMTFWAGDELQADLSGPYRRARRYA